MLYFVKVQILVFFKRIPEQVNQQVNAKPLEKKTLPVRISSVIIRKQNCTIFCPFQFISNFETSIAWGLKMSITDRGY